MRRKCSDSENVRVVRSMYEAFAVGDAERIVEALDPEVRWTEADGLPYGGTYTGPAVVMEEVFAKIKADWDEFSVMPEKVLDAGEHVVVLGIFNGTCRANGRWISAPFAHILRMRGGRVLTFREYTDTALMRDALVEISPA